MASCSTNLCGSGSVPVETNTLQNVLDPGSNTVDGCQITAVLNSIKSPVGEGKQQSPIAANNASNKKTVKATNKPGKSMNYSTTLRIS